MNDLISADRKWAKNAVYALWFGLIIVVLFQYMQNKHVIYNDPHTEFSGLGDAIYNFLKVFIGILFLILSVIFTAISNRKKENANDLIYINIGSVVFSGFLIFVLLYLFVKP